MLSPSLLKSVLLLFLAGYALWGGFHPGAFQFIDGVNILFHEAGHVFFGFFGETPGVWGGTLFQLLLPLIIGIAFLLKKESFSAALMFYWTAENLLPIGMYIQDARAQVLPYVGGETHDWFYILSKASLLEQDLTIGKSVYGLGVALMVLAAAFGIKLQASPQRPADRVSF